MAKQQYNKGGRTETYKFLVFINDIVNKHRGKGNKIIPTTFAKKFKMGCNLVSQ